MKTWFEQAHAAQMALLKKIARKMDIDVAGAPEGGEYDWYVVQYGKGGRWLATPMPASRAKWPIHANNFEDLYEKIREAHKREGEPSPIRIWLVFSPVGDIGQEMSL